MNPGQLVYHIDLGKVVEIVSRSRSSESVYWARQLGRQYISTLFPVRALRLREIIIEDAAKWDSIESIVFWNPLRSKS